jgi:hypothetical protein
MMAPAFVGFSARSRRRGRQPIPHDNGDGAKWGNSGFGNGADRNNTAPGNSGLHAPARC